MSNNTASLAQKLECPKKLLGDTRIWTMDLSDCSRLLYHWAISPYDENNVSSEERQVGVTCQNCQSPLAVVTKSKCHHYRIINCIPEHLKRRWYNGQHSCLPSSWSGFDSRPTQYFCPSFRLPSQQAMQQDITQHMNLKTKVFRYRELNPGHLGESQVS